VLSQFYPFYEEDLLNCSGTWATLPGDSGPGGLSQEKSDNRPTCRTTRKSGINILPVYIADYNYPRHK